MKKCMRPKHEIHLAGVRDARFVHDLATKFSWAIGHLPYAALDARIIAGHVHLARENDEPAGYILAAPMLAAARHIRPIFQAAVCMDAQRRQHGMRLLDRITAEAIASRQTIIQAKCRVSLEANEFWREAGFIAVALEETNAKRGYGKIVWRKPLVLMTADTLLFWPANPRNQTGGGRSLRKHDFDGLPTVTPYGRDDLLAALTRLHLAA